MFAKILVVDDEPDLEVLLRQKFRKKIKQKELELVFACNGVEALEKLSDRPDIDIILTDINMPQMDGLTLLEKLKELHPLLKAVIISGYGDMQNIRKAMNLGAFDFLTKPLNFQDLEITTERTLIHVQQIKNAVEQERLAQEIQAKLLNKLQESKKRLTKFMDAVPIGIFVIDGIGKILYANQTALQVLGNQLSSDALGKQLLNSYYLDLAENKQQSSSDPQLIKSPLQAESFTVESLEINREDKNILLEISATPIYNQSGETVYLIAAFQDITQRT
ncbi:MAG: response regulator [Prochloraceae cyanobacterium]|nr:response regulator [Prochloraceae cyanobacterium]